jgi:hypothetical protein
MDTGTIFPFIINRNVPAGGVMKVYRHFAAGISGNLEIEELSRRIGERHPEVAIEDIEILDSVKGVRYSGISRGQVEIDGTVAELNIDILAMGRRILIFENTIEAG